MTKLLKVDSKNLGHGKTNFLSSLEIATPSGGMDGWRHLASSGVLPLRLLQYVCAACRLSSLCSRLLYYVPSALNYNSVRGGFHIAAQFS